VPNRFPIAGRAFAAILVAAGLLPAAAHAHAILESSSPNAGGSIPAGAVDLEFHYNSRIDHARSRLLLTAPGGGQQTLKIGANDAPDVLTAAATLTPGAYNVRWQVLAVDGHITRGDVPFTVTGP
jgi:copper resistance protein C